jgi:hypothetical protein
MNRRTFLSRSAAAAAFSVNASRLLGARASKLKFGLTSYQWGSEWDLPTMIANCVKAKAFGVELRTSNNYTPDGKNAPSYNFKHRVEVDIDLARRREVKKIFGDSPVKLIGINSGEMFDWPDPARLRQAIDSAKAHIILAHDIGATGIRVFPNNFHPEVPQEQTLAVIAKSLNELGAFAKDYGQKVRLEAHGPVGTFVNLRKIIDQVDQKNVVLKLNSDPRDARDGKFAENFALVKDRLGDTMHFRMYNPAGARAASTRMSFPYQLQWDLLIDAGWDGWCMVEESAKVPDIVQALIAEREEWERMIATSVARA